MHRWTWITLVALAACGGGDPDARVVGTMFTNTCDWGGNSWLGIERVRVELEYSPGVLTDRALPASVQNCSLDTPLFLDESKIEGGLDLPGLTGDPRWAAGPEDGTLSKTREGLYASDIAPTTGSCQKLEDIGGTGVTVTEAGDFDGVTTPAPGTAGLILINDELETGYTGRVARDVSMDLSWSAEGWEQSFVQIRQVGSGVVRQSLTCTTTGMESFKLDPSVWDQLDDLGSTQVEVFVGFQNIEDQTVNGEPVESITRMVHALRAADE
ncbi:MAG: hypothetical protein AB8H79_01770 [Myxococcota bacterium]